MEKLQPQLSGTSLAGCLAATVEDRVSFIARLKAAGVGTLPERQRFANKLAKLSRQLTVEALGPERAQLLAQQDFEAAKPGAAANGGGGRGLYRADEIPRLILSADEEAALGGAPSGLVFAAGRVFSLGAARPVRISPGLSPDGHVLRSVARLAPLAGRVLFVPSDSDSRR